MSEYSKLTFTDGTLITAELMNQLSDNIEHALETPPSGLNVNGKTPDDTKTIKLAAADVGALSGTDATLTQAGKAADAKKVGTELNQLKSEKANKSIISDAWQNGKTYNAGAYCIYNNNLYKALVQTTAEPTSETDWQIVELAGEFVKFNNALAPLSLLKDLAVYRTTGADNRNITVEFNTNFKSINLPFVTFAVIGDGYVSCGRVGKVVNLGENNISATYDTNKNTVTFTVGKFANAALLLFVADANYCIANITQS